MKIKLYCSVCYAPWSSDSVQKEAGFHCSRCGREAPLSLSEAIQREGRVDQCCLCGCAAFYVEKDFNRTFGCSVLILAVGAYIWLAGQIGQYAMAVLLGAAVIDMVAYTLAKDKTVCYRCLAEYRDCVRNPGHQAFDNNIAARYAEYGSRK